MHNETTVRELFHRLADALTLATESAQLAREIALEIADRAGHGPAVSPPAGSRPTDD